VSHLRGESEGVIPMICSMSLIRSAMYAKRASKLFAASILYSVV
jgi:hypothetical protein